MLYRKHLTTALAVFTIVLLASSSIAVTAGPPAGTYDEHPVSIVLNVLTPDGSAPSIATTNERYGLAYTFRGRGIPDLTIIRAHDQAHRVTVGYIVHVAECRGVEVRITLPAALAYWLVDRGLASFS